MSVRIARVEGITLQRVLAMMVAVSPVEPFKIDGSFDSNQPEAISIDLNSSEKRNSLTQRHKRSELSEDNGKARQNTL